MNFKKSATKFNASIQNIDFDELFMNIKFKVRTSIHGVDKVCGFRN